MMSASHHEIEIDDIEKTEDMIVFLNNAPPPPPPPRLFSLFLSYFLKLLLDKKYALPYRVIDSLMSHFLAFEEEERELPVVWHQSLLTFVQRWGG